MITIKKLNKYFNRGKKNEIHVINDTSLVLPDTGLVSLLGPSGCGKTTLLNTIGGLDRPNSGEILINNDRMTRISSNKMDKIRAVKIGYIFQDYNLLDDLTVYENVSIVLKMIGIKDNNEIKKRVDYVLEKTGMYKYRKRLVTMLSGGERQRVGIARAIVKNPEIIIADEPTGNLDSKNTIEIMNIIKSISKDKLVILVTHEKDIAYFYSSRIIDLLDGKVINDKENIHDDTLDYKFDNKIYLKDIKNYKRVKTNNLSIDYYGDDDKDLNISIVIRNGNIYIKTDSKDKLEVVDENSNIELIDDNYKKISKDTYEKYKFDFNNIINENIKLRYSSIYNPITLLRDGFKKIKSYTVLKKILLVGFFISSMFVLYSISNICGIYNIQDKNFVKHNKDYLIIHTSKIDKNKYLEYEKLDNINYILPGESDVNFNIKYDFYYQTYDIRDNIEASLSSIDMIRESDLISGVMPSSLYEVVLDKMSIEKMFDNNLSKQVGLINVTDLIGLNIYLDNMPSFKIVGITDLQSPSIYVDPSLFVNILSNSSTKYNYYMDYVDDKKIEYLDYTLVDDLKIKKGRLPINDYEVIVNYNDNYLYTLNKEIKTKINDTKLKVVGFYESKDLNIMLTNNNTIKYYLLDNNSNITVYPKDRNEVLNYFRDQNINIEDTYNNDKVEYINSRKDYIKSSLIIAGIMLSISLVEIYLMIRSSFLSRIKEVGILRAIGIKKIDIYKMFLGEILAITLTSSLLGLVFMSYILRGITKLPYIKDLYLFNSLIFIIAIIIVFGFNILIGLLPVYNTMRKMPAQILSRTDVD